MSTKSFSLAELAEFLGCEYRGDATHRVTAIAPLSDASDSQITFVAQDKYLAQLAGISPGIVVLREKHAAAYSGNRILAADPYLAYARLSALFNPRSSLPKEIHPTAIVDSSAVLADGVAVGPNCVIGAHVRVGQGTEIHAGTVIGEATVVGDNCRLYPRVTLYDRVTIGDKVTIHSGAVIGADGFGFAPSKTDGWVKIEQLASVRIGNSVEIGANTTIDRGALHDTVVEDGAIIDNLVHLAHGVSIGEGTAIAACVGIAGSTTVGKNCLLGGAVGISGHLHIADNTQFHGGTVVTRHVSEPGSYASAAPMQEVRAWRRNSVRYTQLDEMAYRLRKLEKEQ